MGQYGLCSKGQTQPQKGLAPLQQGFVFAQFLITGNLVTVFPFLPREPPPLPRSQMIGLYIIMEMDSQKAKQDGKMPNYALAFILLDSIIQAFFFFFLHYSLTVSFLFITEEGC